MKHKYYTSFYDNYDKIPSDWYCVALFNDAPVSLQSQHIKNFLFNRDSICSPSKELFELYHSNNDNINEELEQKYLKEVLANFQVWKKVNDGYFSSNVDNFIQWFNYLDESFLVAENDVEKSFRSTFLKLMKYNKIPISELRDDDYKKQNQHQQKIKQLF